MQGPKFSVFLFLGIYGLIVNPVFAQDRNYTSEIEAAGGLDRGDFGPIDLCPDGSFAAQLEFKYDNFGNLDVTAGNAVKLYCFSSTDYTLTGYVTSTEGENGRYQGIQKCPEGVFIVGYEMDVLPNQGITGDDAGVQNVRATCEDGTSLVGVNIITEDEMPEEHVVVENGNKKQPFRNLRYTLTEEERKKISNDEEVYISPVTQDFGPYAGCPPGTLVCGLQTQVEEPNIETDDAGLCNMIWFCCEE